MIQLIDNEVNPCSCYSCKYQRLQELNENEILSICTKITCTVPIINYICKYYMKRNMYVAYNLKDITTNY